MSLVEIYLYSHVCEDPVMVGLVLVFVLSLPMMAIKLIVISKGFNFLLLQWNLPEVSILADYLHIINNNVLHRIGQGDTLF